MSRPKSTPRSADEPPAAIDVRVIPRAGRSGIAGLRDGALLVRLAAAPVDGAANDELIALIARALHIPKRDITIVSGEAIAFEAFARPTSTISCAREHCEKNSLCAFCGLV